MVENSTVLRALCVQVIPWFKVLDVDENYNVLKADGPMFKLFREITSTLKKRYTITKFPQQIYGVKMSDGTWSGMIGQLVKNESDMVVSPIAANFKRLEAIVHTNAVHTTHLCVVSRANEPTATNVTGLLTVFNREVWFALIACMFVMVFVSSWSVKTSSITGKVKIAKANSKAVSEILSQYIATFLFEATPKEPGSSRNRFLFGIWWLSILVLMNAFCGHFRASMMILNESANIEGIKDLIENMDRFHPYVIKGTSYEVYFKFAVSSDNRKIWRAVMEYDGRRTFKDFFSYKSFSELSDRKCALISELSLTKYHIGRHCSRLGSTKIHFGKEVIFPHLFTYAFRKGFEDQAFLREFNRRIRWAIEGNLIEKWFEDESKGAYQRCTTKTIMATERPLEFEDTSGFFLAVLVLQALCFIVLVGEIIIAKLTKNRA